MKANTSFFVFINLLVSLLAADLQPATFQHDVIENENAWVVEFYSEMCGSCQEFAPVWETLTRKLKSIKSGKINIDKPEGMKLAQKLGVLDEGIPNIQFYSRKGSASSLMTGELASTNYLMQELRSKVQGLEKSEDGFYLKA